jgi:HD superfamily phosphodiesterase
MADQLWNRAERDLCVLVAAVVPDLIVWEHSSRVAKLSSAIAALPEVATQPIERQALTAAALYHDAGWVLQARNGEIKPAELLLRPTNDVQRELAADWIPQRLDKIIGPGVIEQAARIIRHCNNRRTELLEAQILTEAENLDEIGPQAIGIMLRKQMAEGKGLSDMVAAWERQEEYHYWHARIKDCFRFESVRALAQARLQALRQFMLDLRVATRLEDLSLLAQDPLQRSVADLQNHPR